MSGDENNDDDTKCAGLHCNQNVSGSCLHRGYDDYVERSPRSGRRWAVRRARRGGLLLGLIHAIHSVDISACGKHRSLCGSGGLFGSGEALQGYSFCDRGILGIRDCRAIPPTLRDWIREEASPGAVKWMLEYNLTFLRWWVRVHASLAP